MLNFFILLICLIAIVIAANLFCNALEHLGEKLKISEGVTGSIFAAVGTALPETIIPILAISGFSKSSINDEIGVGAILGAPLMLSTLSLFVMALFTLRKRGLNGIITPEPTGLKRDLQFFLFSYSLAFLAIFIQHLSIHSFLNAIITITLGFSYFIYLMLTIKKSSKLVLEGNHTEADAPLLISRFGFKLNITSIVLQLFIALLLLIYFAGEFIDSVNVIASTNHISPFLLSLIVIPIATEMPEKINSIIWLRRKKDTLAIGNITGAMVFQGSLLPILGILFTDWSFKNPLPVIGILVTFIATLWFYYNARQNNIRIWHFGLMDYCI